MNNEPALARRLGLGILTLYGIGDILGAGIYALVGKVAETAGRGAWVSFLVSAFLAGVTGLTYAELSSRIPKSAGAAAYSGAAFRHPLLPFLVGFLVLASGLTSTATVSLALHGYLNVLFPTPALAAALALIALLAFLAFWGIGASAWTNAVLTIIEVLGLLLVIVVGLRFVAGLPAAQIAASLTPDLGAGAIFAGATLAFYAFIGFEDLANLAEESKNPERDLPRAILLAVLVSTLIYLAVIGVFLCTVGTEGAAASTRPLLEVLTLSGLPVPPAAFAVVALLAIANTGLTNFVMVSRLLYGMSRQGLLPKGLGEVHPSRRTPWVAVLVAAALVVLLAATGGVRLLAQTTSLLLVIVFTVLHVSLLKVRRSGPAPAVYFRAPAFVPWAGLATCLFLLIYFPGPAFLRAFAVIATGLVVYAALKPAGILRRS